MNILIVEDEATSREILLAILASKGSHTFSTAADGDEAMALLTKPDHGFDLVFLDLELPKISGLDLLERVKASPGYKPVRVIIATTTTDSATVIRAARLGVRHYMIKPADRIHVLEQVDLIQDELAGLPKIESADVVTVRLGIEQAVYLEQVRTMLERVEEWLNEARKKSSPAVRQERVKALRLLRGSVVELGFLDIARRLSSLDNRLSLTPEEDLPESRLIEVAFIISHLHQELQRIRTLLKIPKSEKA